MIYTKKIKTFKNAPFNIERFSSSMEVMQVSSGRPLNPTFTESADNIRRKVADNPEWYGIKDWATVEDYMYHGYQGSVDKLNDIKVDLAGQAKRVSFTNDVHGFAPVVPLSLIGVPNCMVNSYMKPIKAKVLNVYYDMTVNCGVEASDLEKAGQNLLGAILELEMQGYKFNLYAVQGYQEGNSSGGDILCVRIKNSNTPLDIKRMSFALTHPAFFRCVGFDWYTRMPKSKRRMGYGHNLSRDYDDKQLVAGFEEMFGERGVVFSASRWLSKGKDAYKDSILNYGKDVRA